MSAAGDILLRGLKLFLFCLLAAGATGCADRPQSGPVFSVMSYNIGNRSEPLPTVKQIAAVVRKHTAPDVLLVQETPWPVKMKKLAQELHYPYFVSGRKMAARSNLAIFSRLPLSNPSTLPLNHSHNKKPAALSAEVLIDNQTVLFCTVHLATLRFKFERIVREKGGGKISSALRLVGREYFRDTEHSRSVERLVKWLESKPYSAVIAGGDFNTFLFSRPMRIMNRHFDDILWPSMDYFAGTYCKVSFPVKPRIDYIYHSQGVKRIKAEIIRETPGDHYPIRAVFSLSGEKNQAKEHPGAIKQNRVEEEDYFIRL